MRAYVLREPSVGAVENVECPEPGAHQAVIKVDAVGLCGTDAELYAGTMAYYGLGMATYPLRPGHEWTGTVSSIGPGVDEAWLTQRVTGDPILGCLSCRRCEEGRQHLCSDRYEVGVRKGWSGALAEELLVPVSSLYRVPDNLSVRTAAMVEPAANALRSVDAGQVSQGSTVCIWGSGTLALLALQFARVRGAQTIDVVGISAPSLRLAQRLGADRVYVEKAEGSDFYDVVIDASNSPAAAGLALEAVTPGGRVVLIGLADSPGPVDLRRAVLNDITVIGLLSGSPAFDATISMLSQGGVDTESLIAEIISLDDVSRMLEMKQAHRTGAPKTLVDPRRGSRTTLP